VIGSRDAYTAISQQQVLDSGMPGNMQHGETTASDRDERVPDDRERRKPYDDDDTNDDDDNNNDDNVFVDCFSDDVVGCMLTGVERSVVLKIALG